MTKSDTPNKKSKSEPNLITDNTVIELTITWKDAELAYKKALNNQAKNVKSAGFRKGKVPLKMAEEMIGRGKLIEDALNQLLPAVYTSALKKANKQPLTRPDFKPKSVEWGQDWIVEAQIAERPEFKLGDYKKAVKNGKKEAEVEYKKTHPAKPKSAKDDKDSTVAADQHDHSHDHSEAHKREHLLQGVFKALILSIKPSIPELLVREQTRHELERLAQELRKMKIPFEDYLKRRQMSFEQLSQDLAATALSQLQLEFILQDIIDQEKIEVTQVEAEKELKKLSPDPKTHTPQMASYLQTSMKRQKVIDHLLSL